MVIEMKEIIIVVPRYSVDMTITERVSFYQVKKVLGYYPLMFIAPEKLRPVIEQENEQAEYFDDSNFESVVTYSKLLLSPEFYKRFSRYRYMLLYQLDAFVFSDKLLDFCSLGYSYIGAPVPRIFWRDIGQRVGNGGLSLRKISDCIKVTEKKEEIFESSGLMKSFIPCEDKFFGYCGKHKMLGFSIPNVDIAERFSIEYDVARSWSRISINNLPFGCHAWSKPQYFELWKPYIERHYNEKVIETLEREIFCSGRKDYRESILPGYLSYLKIRFKKKREWNEEIKDVSQYDHMIPKGGRYILWGRGEVGRRLESLFLLLNRTIVCFFDIDNVEKDFDSDIDICRPDISWAQAHNYKIVISTSKYENEIKKLLETKKLVQGQDYFNGVDLEQQIVLKYYANIWKNMKNRSR